MLLNNNNNNKIEVYAFVGPSGTGKSYRAQMVAGEYNINYIIDDGLFIKDNEVIAGDSAKKAPTKIETVKHALFLTPDEQSEIRKAIKKYKPESILILGTSNNMVKKIAENLGLPEIKKIIYIDEIATKEEMETARRIRTTEGKHVIPVPTFEIKKDFSGYILDPLQIFKSKGISDTVFRQIVEYLAGKEDAIDKVNKIRVETMSEGIYIYMEAVIVFGFNIITSLNDFKDKVKKEIEKLTTMKVQKIDVVARGVKLPNDKQNI